jgi:LPXTG-motif cell wall-anchored protein
VRTSAALLAAVALALSTAVVSAQTPTTLNFGPGRDANQGGTVAFTAMGQQTRVSITMPSGGAGVQQPAHIHVGTCPGVGAVAFPLTNVVDGRSETTVNVPWDLITASQHSVNVHRSAAEVNVYTACVNLPVTQPPAGSRVFVLKAGRDATQPGIATLTEMGNQTRVVLSMQAGAAGAQQPAHIHVGNCPGVGAVAFPLTNVVDGRSETTVNASMAQIMARQHSINVHRSAAEVNVYTACVDLPLAAAAPAPAPAAQPVPIAAPVQVPTQLPRTGGAPLGLLAAFGAGFLGLGLAFRRR